MNVVSIDGMDDLLFKYERLAGMLDLLRSAMANEVEVRENTIDYTIYEIMIGLEENNKALTKEIAALNKEMAVLRNARKPEIKR
jgi:hypothetical protein